MDKIHGYVPKASQLDKILTAGDYRFKSLKFLLTDSKVGRNTKALVAGVTKRKAEVGSSRLDSNELLSDPRRIGP